MCRIVQILGMICFCIGVAIVFMSSENHDRLSGLGMMLLGGWGGWVYFVIPRNPLGLTGWRRVVATPWVEDAVRRDFLAPGPKDSLSVLHAAKRFTIFCFFFSMVIGFSGLDSMLAALTIGGGAAFIFEWFVRRSEAKKLKAGSHDSAK